MKRAVITLAALTMFTVGCGGGGNDRPAPDDSGYGAADVVANVETIPQADSSELLADDQAGGDGDMIDDLDGLIDCAVINDPVAQAPLFSIQIVAQLLSQGPVDLIKSGSLVFDGPGLTAFLEGIKPLGGHDIPPFGDPADEIEFYLKATELATAIVAVDGPVPQEMFDELAAHNGDVQEFIMRQTSIAAAIDQACP